MSVSLPADVKTIPWAARRLGVSVDTAYRQAEGGKLIGAFRVGRAWRISVVKFEEHYGLAHEAAS